MRASRSCLPETNFATIGLPAHGSETQISSAREKSPFQTETNSNLPNNIPAYNTHNFGRAGLFMRSECALGGETQLPCLRLDGRQAAANPSDCASSCAVHGLERGGRFITDGHGLLFV